LWASLVQSVTSALGQDLLLTADLRSGFAPVFLSRFCLRDVLLDCPTNPCLLSPWLGVGRQSPFLFFDSDSWLPVLALRAPERRARCARVKISAARACLGFRSGLVCFPLVSAASTCALAQYVPCLSTVIFFKGTRSQLPSSPL
jgi:hypothetical protein